MARPAELTPEQEAILQDLRELRESADHGENARAQAEEAIIRARRERLVSVKLLAEAYGVSEGRIYQLLAPGYRPSKATAKGTDR